MEINVNNDCMHTVFSSTMPNIFGKKSDSSSSSSSSKKEPTSSTPPSDYLTKRNKPWGVNYEGDGALDSVSKETVPMSAEDKATVDGLMATLDGISVEYPTREKFRLLTPEEIERLHTKQLTVAEKKEKKPEQEKKEKGQPGLQNMGKSPAAIAKRERQVMAGALFSIIRIMQENGQMPKDATMDTLAGASEANLISIGIKGGNAELLHSYATILANLKILKAKGILSKDATLATLANMK